MTAYADLIQRQNPRQTTLREPARATSAASQGCHGAGQNARPSASFADHMERGTTSHTAERARAQAPVRGDTRTQRTAPARSAAPAGQPPAEPANVAATGKTLPDKRQTSAPTTTAAPAAARVVRNRLEAQPIAASDEGSAKDAAPDAPTTGTEATGTGLPVLALLLAAPAAQEPRASGSLSTAATPRSELPVANQANSPITTAPGQTASATPAVEASTVSGTPPVPAAAAASAAPAMAFVLERDGPVADATAATPAEPNPGAAQAAARAEPSTLAALTGMPEPGRSALHKAREAAEAALPGAPAPAADTSAAALALAQPAAGSAGALPGTSGPVGSAASAQPAEGIGFDALVDSIARARDGAADGAPVAVAMRHAEFGRISLRFHTDADGMSVAMTSPDPAFAPAVAAAHASEAAAASSAGDSDSAGSQPQAGQAPFSQTQSGARSGAGQQQGSQPQQRVSGDPSRNGPGGGPRGSEAPASDRRSGIFA